MRKTAAEMTSAADREGHDRWGHIDVDAESDALKLEGPTPAARWWRGPPPGAGVDHRPPMAGDASGPADHREDDACETRAGQAQVRPRQMYQTFPTDFRDSVVAHSFVVAMGSDPPTGTDAQVHPLRVRQDRTRVNQTGEEVQVHLCQPGLERFSIPDSAAQAWVDAATVASAESRR